MSATDPAFRELGRTTSSDVAGRSGRVLLIPVGSCEQHGPHLPLDTDTRIAVAVCRIVALGRDDVVVAPAVAFGASGEHQSFAGTLSIGTAALEMVLVELGRSAFASEERMFQRMIFVNGHGGNGDGLRSAVDTLVAEGRPVSSWSPRIVGGDAHAGQSETSLLLAIAPEVVGPERPRGNTASLVELLGSLRAGGVASVSPNGVLGDATDASAEEGRRILATLTADLAGAIDR